MASAGRWENKGRGRWEFTGHGWGVYSVVKGSKKWHAFSEPFGAAPQLLGEFDSRPDAQKSVEAIVSRLQTRKKNPSKVFQVYKFAGDIRDGRYLTANSDGSMRWTLTRGDAHKLARKEAETMAAWVRKVFIGHMAIVVPEDKSPWEVLRAKPKGTKLNPKKRRAGKRPTKAPRAKARKNPKPRRPMTGFQVAALRGKKVLFLSGIGLSTSREAASNFGSVTSARRVANQVRNIAGRFGISRVAVVTRHDSPAEIRRFLLGEA